MIFDVQPVRLEKVLNFSNGRSSPTRNAKYGISVYGANGLIGYAAEANSPTNTIVIGRVGSYCGSVHFSNKSCWVTDNAIKATAKDDNDPYFLYYILKHLNLNNWSTGSGQPLINQATLNAIEALIPPPSAQRSIAKILCAIDDRITLLRETNETLETIAQALFKSWFVDFDPVRAKVDGKLPDSIDAETASLFPDAFDDSELGPVPKGWNVETIGELLNRPRVSKRYTKNQVMETGKYPVYEQGASILLGFHNETPTCIASPEKPLFIFGDHTCITKLSCEPFDISQNVILLEGSKRNSLWTYFAIQGKQKFEEYRRHWMELIVKKTVVPNPEVCDLFSAVATPIQLKIEANAKNIYTLTNLRDTLLPRLISGQLRITYAEAELEKATA